MDTHAHLDALEFDHDRDEMVQRGKRAGVSVVVLPAVGADNFEVVRALAHRHGLGYALGIHPMRVPSCDETELDRLAVALRDHRDDPRLVAVGEIGVDGFDPSCTTAAAMQKQRNFLQRQLQLAREHGLPVVMHVRRAVDPVLAALRRTPVPGGIAHAFNGSLVQATQLIEMGMRLGFGGAMTFERALHLRRLAAQLPAGSIVLETDAPDIAPQWLYRTREQRSQGAVMRNESAELPRIGQTLADIRGWSLHETCAITTHNACAALSRLSALLLEST